MSIRDRSLLDTTSLTSNEILSLFKNADRMRQRFPQDPKARAKIVALVFLEPSTRTRVAFQTATYRLGAQAILLEAGGGTSLVKGETLLDTVLNVEAMKPDLMVVRYGRSDELSEALKTLSMPVLNAGSDTTSHPTQGLLDAYTIKHERGKIEGERVLIVGDVAHSRVARSNFDVLKKCGAEVGFCGPSDLLPPPEEYAGAQTFTSLESGLRWATVCMALRIQIERHDGGEMKMSLQDYHAEFGLTPTRLRAFSSEGILLHPGPINHGVELSSDVLHDRRNRILKQVSNGVLIRAALLARALDLSMDEGT